MKNLITVIVFTAFTSSLTGCFPIHFTLNPGVSGKVVDAKSRTPLVANVTLSSSTYSNPNREVTVVTKDDGEFLIPADQEKGIFIVPMDPLTLYGTVTIQVDGYKKIEKGFYTTSMGPAVTELGEIPMEHGE